MQFFTFDLGEFLAYVLPGFLLSVAVAYLIYPDLIVFDSLIRGAVSSKDSWLPDVMILLLLIVASVIGGHLCTVWRRWVLSKVVFPCGKPAGKMFVGGSDYLPEPARQKLAEEIQLYFGLNITNRSHQGASLRIMELELLRNEDDGSSQIEHHTRSKSMCGNFTAPLFLLSIELFWFHSSNVGPGLLLLGATAVLTYKFWDLERRQVRDVALLYLIGPNAGLSTDSATVQE
jgi:hypothetical protein